MSVRGEDNGLIPIPYLPSIGWYCDYLLYRLKGGDAPRLPRHFCRTDVVAPFGRRCLSVPIDGGRRLIVPSRYFHLNVSEHGNWRQTHWSTIESAYGSTPYFHYYEDAFRDIYSRPHETLQGLCKELFDAVDYGMKLSETTDWLYEHPESKIVGEQKHEIDNSLSILHLLFQEGPQSILTLLIHAEIYAGSDVCLPLRYICE